MSEVHGRLALIAADIIYGTVIVAAVVGALSEPLASGLVVVATSILTVELGSMSKVYAGLIGDDIRRGSVTPWTDLLRPLLRPRWMLLPAAVPALAFGVAKADLISSIDALLLTKILFATLLFATGFGSRRLSGAGTARSIVAGVLFSAFGEVLVELKVLIRLLPNLWG